MTCGSEPAADFGRGVFFSNLFTNDNSRSKRAENVYRTPYRLRNRNENVIFRKKKHFVQQYVRKTRSPAIHSI